MPDALGSLSAPTSLLELPTELLVEIVSYHQDPFTFISPLLRPEHGVQQRQDRLQVLRSMSQSCSRLRSIFLPLLWERFHGSEHSFQERYMDSDLKTRLFPFIKSVHVSMQHWLPTQMKTVFLFLEFLRALPNLVGLQIHYLQSDMMPIMMYALKDVVFPTVIALGVPDWSAQVLFKSFPNVTTLACPAIYAGSIALPAAKIHFPRLEALAGLRLSKELINGLLRDFPALRDMSISSTIASESTDLSLLKGFRRLARLSFVYEDLKGLLSLDALINRGAELLRESDSSEARVLTLWSYNVYEGFDTFPRVVSVALPR
ncbi:hypothetical protein B0H17DRAFT_1069370 [Mycena rosella]|uniref:F-box domain-containing protein n=1 Tax=Mycena rosella TaxID=1033263 RepID=A0AAD7DBJ8_MYCRO|nr:hypothetical protein B0H17DRAFT_1069370 [Mycena rosella]